MKKFSHFPSQVNLVCYTSNIVDSQIEDILLTFLREDIGGGDVSSLCFFANIHADMSENASKISRGRFIAKADGIIAGLNIIEKVYKIFIDNFAEFTSLNSEKIPTKPQLPTMTLHAQGGDKCKSGDIIALVEGDTYTLLSCERVILNLIQRMSGIATLTKQVIKELDDPKITILDTRKTAPGLRFFDKMAVRLGGGLNHRLGLYDAVMIKDNHISAAGGIRQAVKAVRDKHHEQYSIEVEVKNKAELLEAINENPDIIMLDNMTPAQITKLTPLIPETIKSEASGGINLKNIASYRGCGVDYISLGALTHSVSALDISFIID